MPLVRIHKRTYLFQYRPVVGNLGLARLKRTFSKLVIFTAASDSRRLEVKSESARLNHNEHSLKDAIINKRVRWLKHHVPAPLTNSPDPATEPAL